MTLFHLFAPILAQRCLPYKMAREVPGCQSQTLADLLGHESVETTREFYSVFEVGELARKHQQLSEGTHAEQQEHAKPVRLVKDAPVRILTVAISVAQS